MTDEVKKEETKLVTETPKELVVVEEKIKEVQKKYEEKVREKNEATQKIRVVNEELVKLAGSYQTLMELRKELSADKKADKETPEKEESEANADKK